MMGCKKLETEYNLPICIIIHVKANETQTRSIQKRLTSPEESSEEGEEKTIEASFKKVRASRNLSPKI